MMLPRPDCSLIAFLAVAMAAPCSLSLCSQHLGAGRSSSSPARSALAPPVSHAGEQEQPASIPLIQIEPAGLPSQQYTTDELLPAELVELAEEVQARWPELKVAANLSRAAEAYVQATTEHRSNDLPPGLLEFLVRWAGCPEPPSIVGILSTTEAGAADVLDQLGEMISNADVRFSTLGIGRVESPRPPFKWRWALILSQRLIEMRPFPARLDPGQREILRFKATVPIEACEIVVLRPEGGIERPPVRRIGASWAGLIEAGERRGTLWVQLLVRRGSGHSMLGLLEIQVGQPRPGVWIGRPVPDESDLHTAEQAEALMAALINRDRRQFGLPGLELDPLLAVVARAHSNDMVANSYFAHVSPGFGAIGRRLETARYPAGVARENISRASAIHESQASLMTSPGHRANLLAIDVSRFGVGVVRDRGPGGHDQWVVTQVFAEPMADLDERSLQAVVRDLIATRRRVGGVQPLAHSPVLERWAGRIATTAALSGELDQSMLVAAQQDLSIDPGSVPTVRAEMVSFGELADCRLGDMISLPELVSYGFGIDTARAQGGPATHTVVILTATR